MSSEMDARRDAIKGVFSRKRIKKIGTGTTTRKIVEMHYFFATEQDDGRIALQRLNQNYIPTGNKLVIEKKDLLDKFSPEPEFYMNNVQPKMREVQKHVATAERHRKRGETFSAEMEYGNALKIDEENIRANFGIGLCYMQRGELKKAADILERLVRLEGAFDPEHKHLYNEFGMNLRKQGMLDEAIGYYGRAIELHEEDEGLHLNIARAYHEKGENMEAAKHLQRSLGINPDFEEAAKFMKFLMTKGLLKPS